MTAVTQAFFETLMRTQSLPAERMRDYQRGLLERLLRHARAQVPYYRDHGRLDPVFARDGTINWDGWDDVPILTRLEAQQNAEALYAETVPPECGDVVTGYTAGSTGTPLAFRVNTLQSSVGSAVLERGLVWAGVPEQVSLAWFRNDRQGGAPDAQGTTYESTIRGARRLTHHLAVQTPFADQGRWVARVRPDMVMGYPGALALLGRELPPELGGHRFRLAIGVGEVMTDGIRAEIAECFRCPVMDLYSGSDFGPVAVEDVTTRKLLICEEVVLVEFQEPDGIALADSELAEIIVTPFYNYAMPLIRYVPGDFAVVDAMPATDGRTLRRLERIAGRDRNFFIMPSGRRWWPTFQNKVLCDWLNYKQIQFAQTGKHNIEIRFASDDPQPIKNVDRLMAYLRAAIPEPMEVTVTQVAEIRRRASGKYEYATCEVASA